jgi:hypothetical protein
MNREFGKGKGENMSIDEKLQLPVPVLKRSGRVDRVSGKFVVLELYA